MPEDDEVEQEERVDIAAPRTAAGSTSRDDYGVGRLLALSDGVFAVAMTLLVVDIRVVPPPADATSADGLRAFGQELPALGIYAFSFAMVAVYWLNHHRGMRTLQVATRAVLFRNLALLLLVCLMPFATAFFQRFPNTTAGNEVYLGALFLLGLISALTVPWRERVRRLSEGPGRRRHVIAIYLEQVGSLPVFALGFVLARWIPGSASLIVLVLIVLTGIASFFLTHGLGEPLPDPDRYGVGRMLTLSDDVFAIALTLLVLNIAIPEVGTVGDQARALSLLAKERNQVIAFVITFAVIGIYWSAHHRALRRVTTLRSNILRRNLVLLFTICLVPFVTDFFDAWDKTVFGNQFFFAALGIIGGLTSVVGPTASRVRAGLRRGWAGFRDVGSVAVASGAVPVCVVGVLLAPVLGPGNAQLVWVLMAPLVVAERIISGESLRAAPR